MPSLITLPFLRSADKLNQLCDRSYRQEFNLDRMFADAAGFAQEASAPAQIRHLMDRCINRIAILIGAGARDAAPHLIEIATLLGPGVAKALLGKDVLPVDLPFVTGAIGLLGTEPSWDLMQGCDTLLMVGTGFPWSEFPPKDGSGSRRPDRYRSVHAFATVSGRCQSRPYPGKISIISLQCRVRPSCDAGSPEQQPALHWPRRTGPYS
jgi:hypothetical protein